MGKKEKGFNANNHKGEDRNYAPMPAGEYTLALVKAERKASNNNPDNSYMNCQFKVVKGKYTGAVVFEILNLDNSNEMAQKIAEAQLASFMLAVGITDLKSRWDFTPLLNKEFKAILKITKDDKYGDKNNISKFIPMDKKAKKKSAGDPWDKPEKKKKKKKK